MISGRRAVYKGYAFEYTEKENDIYELFTNIPSEITKDFKIDSDGFYVKSVSCDELDAVYFIQLYAKYKGHTFSIWEINEDQLLLGEGDYFIAKEFGFTPSELPWERGLYKKWILKSDTEAIWEEKKPL